MFSLGTTDPSASTGAAGACNTGTGVSDAKGNTGSGTACKSTNGVEDTVANVAEWTGDWMHGPSNEIIPAWESSAAGANRTTIFGAIW